MRKVIQNPKSRLWTAHCDKFVAAFSKTNPSPAVRENAYAFLDLIQHLLGNHQPGDDVAGNFLVGNVEMMPAVWNAAVSKPFLGRHVYSIRELPEKAEELGVTLTIPAWWDPALAEFLPKPEPEAETEVTPPAPIQEPEQPKA